MADERQEITEEQYATMVYEDAGELTVNLADVAEAKFENVPRGIYLFEVDQTDYVEASQSSGRPMITAWLRISEGEYQGRRFPYFFSFSPKALPFTKAALNRLAPDIISQGSFQPRNLAESGDLVGRQIRGRIDLREDRNDKSVKRSAVTALLAASGMNGA